jgi:hypothetical protein
MKMPSVVFDNAVHLYRWSASVWVVNAILPFSAELHVHVNVIAELT